MARLIQVSVLTFAAACCVVAVACSSDNDPATNSNGSDNPTTTAGNANTTAGDNDTTTPPVGMAGSAPVGMGGSTSMPAAGAGGAPVATAGSTSMPAGMYSPLCAVLTTAAGPSPTKGGACTDADSQLCYKTCGPQGVGFKSETCTGGAYVEQSGCSFPPESDYSCYKVPATPDASCPTTPPQASMPCTATPCKACSAGNMYLDSTGMQKAGYCVCPMPGTSGTSKWSCASATAWPCPAGKGC